MKLEDLAISVASHGLSGDRVPACCPKGAGVCRGRGWAVSVAGLVGLELVRGAEVKRERLQQVHVVSVTAALHRRLGPRPALRPRPAADGGLAGWSSRCCALRGGRKGRSSRAP